MTACSVASLASQRRVDFASCSRHVRTSCWRWLVIVVVGLSAGLIVVTRGHADEEDEEVALNAGERQIVFTEQQFDQMVFGAQAARGFQAVQVVQGRKGNQPIIVSAQPAEMDFQKRMSAAVAIEIQAIDGRVSLTEAQKKKLKLAARGDIAELVDLVAELRPKLTSKPLSRWEYSVLMQQLQPLRPIQQFGIISEDSLFRKTLRGILTDQQRVRWQAFERERKKGIIEAALQISERTDLGLKLRGEVRNDFIELVLDHGQLPQSVGPYGQWIVFLEANLLRDRVKLLLNDDEWKRFEWQVGQSKRYVPTLETYGIWTARRAKEDDDEASAEPARDRR